MAQYGKVTIAVPLGVATQAAFGTPVLTSSISVSGYASQAQLGVASVVVPQGQQSQAAAGAPVLGVTLPITGVASAAAFGTPSLGAAPLTVNATGLASSASLGSVSVAIPQGYASQAQLGTPTTSTTTVASKEPNL